MVKLTKNLDIVETLVLSKENLNAYLMVGGKISVIGDRLFVAGYLHRIYDYPSRYAVYRWAIYAVKTTSPMPTETAKPTTTTTPTQSLSLSPAPPGITPTVTVTITKTETITYPITLTRTLISESILTTTLATTYTLTRDYTKTIPIREIDYAVIGVVAIVFLAVGLGLSRVLFKK